MRGFCVCNVQLLAVVVVTWEHSLCEIHQPMPRS